MSDSPATAGVSLLERLHAWDQAAYDAVAGTDTPLLDEPLRRLSSAADYSRVSMAAAAALATFGGPRGRRAAVTGLASVAVASAVTNTAAKLLTRRPRPERARSEVVERRHVEMPTSTSFPSGHTAAAFAFATGVANEWPAAGVPAYLLAAVVGYSRVHTGVHFPGDVAAGAGIGLAAAAVTTRSIHAVRP